MTQWYEVDGARLGLDDLRARLLERCDALKAGEAIEVCNTNPTTVLALVNRERPESFDCKLMAGAGDPRVRVIKRGSDVEMGLRDAFERESHELHAVLADIAWKLQQGLMMGAASKYPQVLASLDRHIELEEKFVFPLFEETTETSQKMVLALKAEHEAIRALSSHVHSMLRGSEPFAAIAAVSDLEQVLGAHASRETRAVHSCLDNHLGKDVEPLVQRLRARVSATRA